MRIEKWLDNEIRFVEINGKWFAVANDVAKALGYVRPENAITRHCKRSLKRGVLTNGGEQQMKVIPESDIYRLIMRSQLDSAIKFEEWVMDDVLPKLRQSSGLEGFQVFRMMIKSIKKVCLAFYTLLFLSLPRNII